MTNKLIRCIFYKSTYILNVINNEIYEKGERVMGLFGSDADRIWTNDSDGQRFYGYDSDDGKTDWYDSDGKLDSSTDTPFDDE